MSGLLSLVTASNSARLGWHIRLMRKMRERGHRRLARLIAYRIQNRFSVYISVAADIAPTVVFPHPTGIVIGDGVIIGDGARIYQNVTLGGARMGDQQKHNYPTIGAGSVLFAGVVVVGKVRIGENCVVGANSVVLSSIPDGTVAVGSPARVIRQLIAEPVLQDT